VKYVGYILGFGLFCGYTPQIYSWSGEDVGRWALAWICVAILLCAPREPLKLLPSGVLFLVYAITSLIWATVLDDALFELLKWFLLLGCFVAGAQSKFVFEGAVWGVAVNSLLAIGQSLGFHPVMEVSSPAGFFGNRDELAEAALLVGVYALEQKNWKGLVALPALLLPHSRAVLIAGFVVLLAKRYWIASIVVVIVAVVYTREKGVDVEGVRVWFWYETLRGLTVFGHGLGQFYSSYLAYSDLHVWRIDHAHNDWLEIGFEFGIPGFILAGLFVWRLRKDMVFLAFCTMALVSFCLHNPATAVLGFFAAGAFYRNSCMVREPVPVSTVGVRKRYSGERLATAR
jgi:hypothetical protein